jgi:ATP-binding cassette subfamily B protein
MVTVLQENLTGIRVVKAFAAERHERAKFFEAASLVADETRDAQVLWAGNFSVMNFLFTVAIGAIIWVGGNQVMDGRTVVDGEVVFTGLTPGEFTAFIFYMGLLTMPVRMMGWMVNSFSRASSCGERLFAIMDAESPVDDAPGAEAIGRVQGRVRFEGVSFRYDGGALALRTIDLDVAPGQTIALLGRPGSGKTTFAHLIPRFYDVSDGRVTVDGTDVRDVTLASLRENVGIVQQDVFIHSMSIADNIAYGAAGVSPERIAEVARVAQLDEFISELPDGYDTVVGERGIGLSGGQKQRLSIARTLLRDPPIIILDDSTSSVDAQTEHRLRVAVESATKGRTTFVITHRLSTIRGADTILVFKDGEIVQRGTHGELMSQGGEYRELYELQLRPQEDAALQMSGADGAREATV